MYLKIPVMGELQWKMALDQMSATLATLLRSGLPLLEALDILQNAINNRHFAYCIGELEVYLRGGRSLSDSLARHQVFTPIMIRMVAVGEESGMLDEMLQKVSTFYHNEVEALTERLTQMLEPIIVVGLGVVVCFLLLAMYMPMFDAFRGVG
jgi:type IV pilus assembly protein PilC